MLVHLPVVGGNKRTLGTQSHAANALGLALLFPASALDVLIESVFDALTLARQAARRYAHFHLLGELALRLVFRLCDFDQLFRCHCDFHFPNCSRIAEGVTFPATSRS